MSKHTQKVAATKPIAGFKITLEDVQNSASSFAETISTNGNEVVGGYSVNINPNIANLTFGFTDINNRTIPFVFPGAVDTFIKGVNNAGEVIGTYTLVQGAPFQTGFVYQDGIFTTLQFDPIAINNKGVIVGQGTLGSGSFVLNDGISTPFMHGTDQTVVSDINDSGNIVGYYIDHATFAEHGFIYKNGTFATVNVPGAANTSISAINNNGDVVGSFSDTNNMNQGFLDHAGKFNTQIGISHPEDVNNSDVIAGGNFNGVGYDARVWANGKTFDLSPIGSVSAEAKSVADNNTVVGYFGDPAVTHGFVATPFT